MTCGTYDSTIVRHTIIVLMVSQEKEVWSASHREGQDMYPINWQGVSVCCCSVTSGSKAENVCFLPNHGQARQAHVSVFVHPYIEH